MSVFRMAVVAVLLATACWAESLLNRSGKNKAVAPAALRQGWNRLLVRNDHLQWQRQFACALLPVEGDTLDDLRYSLLPR